MAAAPPQVANFIKDVVALKTRVRNLELAALRKTASTLRLKLGQLLDVKVASAVEHQVLTYMGTDWVARGGNVIIQTFTASGTGNVIMDEALVDPAEWPADQVWAATATAYLTPTGMGAVYETGTTPLFLGITGTTAITLDSPDDTSTALDFTADGITVDFPLDVLERQVDIPHLLVGLMDGPLGMLPAALDTVDATYEFIVSCSWIFQPGAAPHVFAELASSADTYPDGGDIEVVVHLYPLP